MSRPLLAGVAAMAMIVVASNVLVQFLFGDWLTWGAFTYPFAFLVTDLVNRFHGPREARKVVVAGFLVGLACSFVGAQIEGPFGPLVSLRVAIASGAAFLVGQLLDVAVFNRLRRGSWWRAPFVASVAGQRRRHRGLLLAGLFRFARLHRARTSTSPGRTSRCRCSGAGRWRRCGCRSRLPTFASSWRSRCSRWRHSARRSGWYQQRA